MDKEDGSRLYPKISKQVEYSIQTRKVCNFISTSMAMQLEAGLKEGLSRNVTKTQKRVGTPDNNNNEFVSLYTDLREEKTKSKTREWWYIGWVKEILSIKQERRPGGRDDDLMLEDALAINRMRQGRGSDELIPRCPHVLTVCINVKCSIAFQNT